MDGRQLVKWSLCNVIHVHVLKWRIVAGGGDRWLCICQNNWRLLASYRCRSATNSSEYLLLPDVCQQSSRKLEDFGQLRCDFGHANARGGRSVESTTLHEEHLRKSCKTWYIKSWSIAFLWTQIYILIKRNFAPFRFFFFFHIFKWHFN